MASSELRELLVAITRVEAKVDALMQMQRMGQMQVVMPPVEADVHGRGGDGGRSDLFFRQFTAKQNATLQMVLRGAENSEIAERLGVSPNTAKVHVRVIAGKLGVNNRVQIAMKARGPFDEIDDATYKVVSGGLPKDWDANYQEPDPYGYVYRREEENDDSGVEE